MNCMKFLESKWFAFALYAILAVIITWPLLIHTNGFLLPQQYPDINHSDTMQHIGKLDEARGMIADGRFPVIADSTDISHLYLYSGLALTSLGVGITDTQSHNIYFIVMFMLSGLFMYYFMYELSKDKLASLLAGVIYITSQYMVYAYYWGHSNTFQIQWVPLIFLALERMLKHKEWKHAILFGAAFSLQIFSASQLMIYLSFFIPLYVLLRQAFIEWKEFKKLDYWTSLLKKVGVAFVTILVIAGWYLLKKISVAVTIRTLEENTRTYWILNSVFEVGQQTSFLYMGWVQLILLAVGVYLLIKYWNDKQIRPYAAFAVMWGVVVLCMLGPHTWLYPYTWLFNFWPYFDRFRVPFRLFPLALLSLSVMGGFVISYSKKFHPNEKRRLFEVLLIFLLIILQVSLNVWLSNTHMYYI